VPAERGTLEQSWGGWLMKGFLNQPDGATCSAADGGMPTMYTGWELPLGSKLLFLPDSTKTGARDGPMEAVVTGGLLCCVIWLRWLLLAGSRAAGCSITNYVTRPHTGMHSLSKLQWASSEKCLCCPLPGWRGKCACAA